MKTRKQFCQLAGTVFLFLAFGQWSIAAALQTVAYVDATIETAGPDGSIVNGTLVVRDGKIVAIGKDVEIPSDAKRVSMTGKTIMPGLVDPYFVFSSSRPTPAPTAQTFGGRRFRGFPTARFTLGAFVNVKDYFYPYTSDFVPGVRTGITTANLVSSGRGHSAFARLNKKPSKEMLMETDGLLFTRVTNQTSALDTIRNGLKPPSSRTRPGTTTRSTTARTGASTGTTSGGSSAGASSGTASSSSTSSANSTTQKAWTEVREGKKPLLVNVNNAATVAHVLRIVNDNKKARLCLVATGPNLYESLQAIKGTNVNVVLQPGIDTVPYTSDRMNVAQMIEDMEIPFALSMSLNGLQMRGNQDDPMFPLAMLVKAGLSRKAAIEAVTIQPAKILGLDASHGSLEKGKVADFLIFSGDPLTTGSQLEKVVSQGKTIHEN